MDSSLLVAFVLVVAGVLALEFGISSALTEILAGVLLAVFLDVSALGWLGFLSHFGMLGLMFMAGFEMDPQIFARHWRSALGIGLASFAVPFLGVYAWCRWVLHLAPLVSALLGIGLSTTSIALVYHYLHERQILAGRRGQAVLGAAMTVDVLSMLALALLLGNVGWATAIFLIVAIPGLRGLPRLGQWIFSRYRGSVVEFELRFLLLVLVGLGFLSENVGIHAALVSFAVGLVMTEVIQDHEVLEEKMKGIVFSFFAPVFFLRAGTEIDLAGLGWRTAGMAAALFLLAVGLKYAGTALGARLAAPGLGHFVGVLFNYRLTFGIITATVGLQEGILTAQLFSLVMLVVVASAALPAVFLRAVPSELGD